MLPVLIPHTYKAICKQPSVQLCSLTTTASASYAIAAAGC
jgi:hypothetical protein